jgi:peptidoglycan/xylan/chitin deacetylase (PgdA/CDA1 family)
MNNGKFVISLDFELMWGVRDKKSISSYGENIAGVHKVIPRLLEVFDQYGIKATFSTVGFLFFKSKKELLAHLPETIPAYTDANLSPYNGYFHEIKEDYKMDPYHYAHELISEIQKYPEQEIGSHTFSHYYCLENGQTIEAFRADLKSAITIAEKNNVQLTSLVFPRNQFNEEYLKVCLELGVYCYRGNENSWLYEAKNGQEESQLRRGIRLMDAYINISGHHTHKDKDLQGTLPINIPASRFLRPYSSTMKSIEWLRLHRIKASMTYAAKHNQIYHLWWHPHNFGINQNENFLFLEKILKHYQALKTKYDFTSYTMSTLAKQLKNES